MGARRRAGAVRGLRARLRGTTAEPSLAAYWDAYADERPARPWLFCLRHPWLSLTALVAVLRLPVATLDVAEPSPDAAFLLALLDEPGVGPVPLRSIGLAALRLPEDPADYSRGRRRQTLRRKVRKALREDVACRPVHDDAERRRLLDLASEAETRHPDDWYRQETPDNADLLDFDTWMVAESPGGEPLLLAVVPVCGQWAALRYFRTLGWGRVHSDARYLATQALAERLAAQGVRWLLDTEHPGEQSAGARHFQRMVGFRFVRARIEDQARRAAAAPGPAGR